MTDFAAPGSMNGLEYSEMLGHLLVIEPLLYEPSISTSMGEKDAIRANVLDVTEQAAHEDVLIFPRVLVNSLRGRMGQKVLGHLGQGTAKTGQNAPWVILDASGDPAAAGQAAAFMNSLATKSYSAPATSPGSEAAANLTNLTSVFGAKEVEPPF